MDRLTEDICRAVAARATWARDVLLELIRVPSPTGEEGAAVEAVLRHCSELGVHTEQVPVPPDLCEDPDYSSLGPAASYAGRPNLVLRRPGTGAGRSLLLQSHLDTVPAPPTWTTAFTPMIDGDFIVGRGACDAKGQVVAILLALQALQDAGVQLPGEVQAQFVIEEEIGGNGALALITQGHRADAVIIAEATGLHVHPASRGALWFRLRVTGRSAHMGRAHEGVNAIEKLAQLLPALRRYEAHLLAESQGQPLFTEYARPVQMNFGQFQAGEWPATVAGEAVLEGGVGFLPNKRLDDIKGELRQVIEEAADDWTRGHYELDFPKLHNDAYAGDPDHPAVTTLVDSCRALGLAPQVLGWNVSCDARLYHYRGRMPTLIFGPGDIADAHAVGEKIALPQVVQAAQALALMCLRWCR